MSGRIVIAGDGKIKYDKDTPDDDEIRRQVRAGKLICRSHNRPYTTYNARTGYLTCPSEA